MQAASGAIGAGSIGPYENAWTTRHSMSTTSSRASTAAQLGGLAAVGLLRRYPLPHRASERAHGLRLLGLLAARRAAHRTTRHGAARRHPHGLDQQAKNRGRGNAGLCWYHKQPDSCNYWCEWHCGSIPRPTVLRARQPTTDRPTKGKRRKGGRATVGTLWGGGANPGKAKQEDRGGTRRGHPAQVATAKGGGHRQTPARGGDGAGNGRRTQRP